jgi:hypothetical protein
MVHLTQDQVSRYLEKRLTRTERVELSEHLSICEHCRPKSTEHRSFQIRGQRNICPTGRSGKFSLRFRAINSRRAVAIDMQSVGLSAREANRG